MQLAKKARHGIILRGPLAQLAEQLTLNQWVPSSSLGRLIKGDLLLGESRNCQKPHLDYLSVAFFTKMLMLTSPATKTMPLRILATFSAVEISWGRMAVMCIFAMIPAMIISLFLNRYFVQGLTLGAAKG